MMLHSAPSMKKIKWDHSLLTAVYHKLGTDLCTQLRKSPVFVSPTVRSETCNNGSNERPAWFTWMASRDIGDRYVWAHEAGHAIHHILEPSFSCGGLTENTAEVFAFVVEQALADPVRVSHIADYHEDDTYRNAANAAIGYFRRGNFGEGKTYVQVKEDVALLRSILI